MCAGCHGEPGKEQNGIYKRMVSLSPALANSKEVYDPKEFFWIIKNGIKMTAMPLYGSTKSDEKIWAITSFVTNKLQKMSASDYERKR